jgi:hypothetical protein
MKLATSSNRAANAAEPQVAFILVPDHGVQGVDHLVGHGQGSPAQHGEEQWGDEPVDQVFGHGFHGGAGHPPFVQAVDFPAHDHGHRLPSGVKARFAKRLSHGQGRIGQTAGRDAGVKHKRLHQDPGGGVDGRGGPDQQQTDHPHACHQQRRHERAGKQRF